MAASKPRTGAVKSNAAAAGWDLDAFDDGQAKKVAVDAELNKLQKFVSTHKNKLQGVVNQIETSLGVSYDASLEPINLRTDPYESLSVLQLVHTENKMLNKIFMALSSICTECETLVNEAYEFYFPSLVMYGETPSGNPVEEGEAQVMMGRMLLFLQDLCNYVNRVYEVVQNMMRQLASLWTPNKVNNVHFEVSNVHFLIIFEKLADLFGVLISLDKVIDTNEYLNDHWTLYKRMIALIRNDPSRFEAEEGKLRLVEKMLQRIEGRVLDGSIYQNCVELLFDIDGLVNVTKNLPLGEEMSVNIKNYFQYLKDRIGSASETDQRLRFLGFAGLFVFHYKIFRPNVDQKYFKLIYQMHKIVPVVHIFGNVYWSPSDFFESQVPKLVQLLGKSDVLQSRQASLKKIQDNLPQFATDWYHLICVWMVRLTSELAPSSKIRDVLNTRTALFIQGLFYASSVSNLISETISLHLMLNAPLSKKVVRPLCRLIELLKSIQATYRQQVPIIANGLVNVFQHLSASVHVIVAPIRDRLLADRRQLGRNLDVLTGLNLLISMIDGPPTRERMILAELALSTTIQLPTILKAEELDEVHSVLRKMDVLSTLQHRLAFVCDCHFMYWNKVLLPTYFSDMYTTPHDAHNMQYMMAAIRDTKPILDRCMNEPVELIKKFESEIEQHLMDFIVKPLSKDIETDLRLHIHSHLKLDDRNPFKVGLKDLTAFLNVLPLRLFARTLDIKAVVTHYLDTTFYDLTTVALHDWRTYAEMRNLALEKYDIEMTEVHLPSGTLEQGVDALEIMRNIHVFVTRYNYNLNNQIFVERNSNNKHLNTINIRHIANSIRTHGTGVMNTTVNVTYQFLRKKFRTFSEFLYDDHIKSRLIKEIRFYRESKEELNQKYPYAHAEKFVKSMRKLGESQDGTTYLDEFRNLITTIGNALAYIRMVRSGGLHYCSNAINFVPELNDILRMEDLVVQEGLSAETALAAKNFDGAVENLSKNFSESTDYFQLLVDVFAKEFRDAKNAHLKNFYVIIPALTLNFVDYMLNSKDKIDKKRKEGASFTDDGFPMGVAYILKLLDQNAAFDSLHWFQSVDEYYITEAQKMSDPKKRKDEQQSIVLTQQKIGVLRKEYDLLYFSLTGARIFFREEGENFAAATAEKEGADGIQAEAAAAPLEAAPAQPTIDG